MSSKARRGRFCRTTVLALLAVTIVAGVTTAVGGQTEHRLRIAAQRHADGRTEVALQQRQDDGEWGDRLLPSRRFVPANAPSGRWLAGSPLTVDTTHGVQDLRIAARRHADSSLEVALQQQHADGTWGERILPALRIVPPDASTGRWLASSPLTEPEPRGEPEPATAPEPVGEPEPAGDAEPSGDDEPTGDAEPAIPTADEPPEGPDSERPRALMTPTGVPVAVIGTAGSSYLVRTPCGNAAEITAGTPIENVRVVLDPGHGGRFEVGAVGPNGLAEDELNLTLSRAILAELARREVPAAITRTGDYGSLLSVRAAFADALGADALISIHHNAPTHRLGDSPGTEVYVQSTDDETPRADSGRLGGLLYEEITGALAMFEDVSWSRLPNAGVLRVLFPDGGDAYGMIRRPAIPAVLVEYGYLSNPSEAELFATDEYISAAAVATVDAIEAYLNTDRPGTGFVEQPRRFDPAPAPSRCDEIPLE